MSSTEENAPNSQETDRQTIPIGSTSFSINVTFARSFLGIFEAVIIVSLGVNIFITFSKMCPGVRCPRDEKGFNRKGIHYILV